MRADPFYRVRPLIFYGICNQHVLNLSRDTGKIPVLFIISVTNLHFSEIEGSGPKSCAENRINGESKNTRCRISHNFKKSTLSIRINAV
jgi:hypothetical protein